MDINEKSIKGLVEDFNKNHREKTFAEFIAVLFEGKFIEIYLGDSYEEISTEQISTAYPAVFCGKVITAFKECLVLNAIYADSVSRKAKLGNVVFINERAIRGLSEIDGNGRMEDNFLRSSESLSVKKLVNNE